MTYRHIDLSYLDTISNSDNDLRKTLMEMVQAELQIAFSTMNQAFNTKNWEAFHEIAHKLKSTLAFVGNPELSQVNQHILSNLEEKIYTADYPSWLKSFKQLSDPILVELESALTSAPR